MWLKAFHSKNIILTVKQVFFPEIPVRSWTLKGTLKAFLCCAGTTHSEGSLMIIIWPQDHGSPYIIWLIDHSQHSSDTIVVVWMVLEWDTMLLELLHPASLLGWKWSIVQRHPAKSCSAVRNCHSTKRPPADGHFRQNTSPIHWPVTGTRNLRRPPSVAACYSSSAYLWASFLFLFL